MLKQTNKSAFNAMNVAELKNMCKNIEFVEEHKDQTYKMGATFITPPKHAGAWYNNAGGMM